MSTVVTYDAPSDPPRALHSIIDTIGDDGFVRELLLFLNDVCGAEHCAIFRLEGAQPVELGAASLDGSATAHRCATLYVESQLWQRDPTMTAARFALSNAHPTLIRMRCKR